MCELEFVNGFDQSFLEDTDPINNMWAYYQHANILPLLSKDAQRIIMRYRKLGQGATVQQIREWHENRFKNAGKVGGWFDCLVNVVKQQPSSQPAPQPACLGPVAVDCC